MTNARRYLFLSVLLCLGTAAAWASSVVVNTSLSTSVTISSTGTVAISLPTAGVSTFAEGLDTSGGSDASDSNPANAADSTLATGSASGSATATTLTGSTTANVNLPDNFNGEAYSVGDTDLSGTFEISGIAGSVNVTFSASPSVNQSLDTTGPGGQSAYSNAIFSFSVQGVSPDPILYYLNEPSIGPAVFQSYGSPSALTDTLSLSTNTPYYFDFYLDAESDGVSMVPEPSSLSLVLTTVGLLAVLGRRLTRKPNPDGRG
jgi:hypothetical protein